MTSLSAQMDAALKAGVVIPVLMIEARLPVNPLQLFFGNGAIAWGDKVFRDSDVNYGQLAAIDEIEDGIGEEAMPFTFTMIPASNAAAAALCSPALQGSEVFVWLGALSPVSLLLLPEPELLGYFEWDIGTLSPDRGTREVEVECTSAFDLLLEDDEGARLTDSHHQSIWPGETGCANVTGLPARRYWGMATPRAGGTLVTDPGARSDQGLQQW